MISTSNGWEDEMGSLEAQLNTTVRMQIEHTREGIRRLGESQDRLRAISSAFGRATGLCQQSEELIDNYPVIRHVSRTCENFRLVRAVYDRFAHLDETVARTEELLRADLAASASGEGEWENLLLIYRYLHRLQAFRTQTFELMKDAPQAVMYTLRRYFKKLDDLLADFDAAFWALPRDSFYLMAVGGRQGVITRWALVLARMDAQAAGRFTSLMCEWAGGKFALAAQGFPKQPSVDVEGTLQCLEWWQGDLSALRDGLVPCFPPRLGLLDSLANAFHGHIGNAVQQCVAMPTGGKPLEAGDILYLLRWSHEYYAKMAETTGLTRNDLDPPLLTDAQEAALIAAYLSVARAKVTEWIGNVYEAERQAFTQRPQEPEVDAANCYLSPASVDLIQILRQHITTASEAGQGKLVLEVIADASRTVASFQERLGALLKEETERWLAKPEATQPHFEPYVIMLGNTGLRWATSLQSEIIDTLESILPPEYGPAATKHLKALAEGFIGLAKQASAGLTRIILATVHEAAINQLFTTAAWYDADPSVCLTATITATFADFLSDYQAHAEDFLFTKLVADLLDALVLAYLQQLRARSTKIKPVPALGLFEQDARIITEFFARYRDPRRVQKSLDALSKFGGLVASSPKMIYLEFFAFFKVYPDVPMQLLEEVLLRREDLDKAAVREILETCKRKTQEEQQRSEQPPSIFSRIKL